MVRIKSLAKKWKQKSYKCIALGLQTSPSGATYFESDRWWTSLWSLRLPGTIIQNGWFWAFGILIHRETQMTRKNLKWQTKNRLCVNCTQNDLIIQFTNATVFFTSQIHEYNTIQLNFWLLVKRTQSEAKWWKANIHDVILISYQSKQTQTCWKRVKIKLYCYLWVKQR